MSKSDSELRFLAENYIQGATNWGSLLIAFEDLAHRFCDIDGTPLNVVIGIVSRERGEFGIRIFDDVSHEARLAIEELLDARLPVHIIGHILDATTVRCFDHEDCRGTFELARACYLSSRYLRRRG